MKFLVYKVTFPNDKVYIGITSKNLKERKRKHYTKINNTEYKFYRALKKYKGTEIWEEFCYSKTWKDTCKLEKYFIQYFNSFINGYNSTLGGDGTLGYKHSRKAKKKISNALSGKNNPNYKRNGNLNYNAKSIICIESNKIYGSLIEAAKDLNISFKQISKVLRGQNKSAKGHTFKYSVGETHAKI